MRLVGDRSTSSAPACWAPRSGSRCPAAGSRSGSATSTTSTCARPPGSVRASPHRTEDGAQLVVVAVPPDHIAAGRRARRWQRGAVVTDVGSVKCLPLDAGRPATSAEAAHPLRRQPPDGRQRALGPARRQRRAVRRPPVGDHAAPHVLGPRRSTPSSCSRPACGAATGADHAARARPRGRPHLPPAAPDGGAGRGTVADADPSHLALSGQGVRDVTRIAAGDPALWRQILICQRAGACARSCSRHPAGARRADRGARRAERTSTRCCAAAWPAPRRSPASTADRPSATALGLRLGARPSRRAGPAVRRRGGDRHQHRGPAHRPRPRSPGRSRRARGEGHVRGAAPATLSRPGTGSSTGRIAAP